MKKLLMIGAILAIGTTMAYGETTENVTTDVKVIAEIVNENFVITDLDGNPIVLDFGKISGNSYGADATNPIREVSKGYKMTYVGADSGVSKYQGKNITMTLTDTDSIGVAGNNPADGTAYNSTKVLMRRQVTAGDTGNDGNDTITSNIFLSEYKATLATVAKPNDVAYIGQIGGYMTASDLGTDAAPASGEYLGTAELKVTIAGLGE